MAGLKKYRVYPECNFTNTEGLVQLPSHWELKQVRYLLKDGAEGTKIGPFGSSLKLEDMVDDGVQVYGQENVIKRDFSIGKRRVSFNKFKEMRVYEVFFGDILITMMGTSGKCEIVPYTAEKGIIDSHLIRVRVNDKLIIPDFFKLLVDESPEIKHQIKIQGKGSIMLGLNSSVIRSLYLPLPGVSEQKIILSFLDYETAKIDNLIEKQQQLIELLKEKRQAVISHAVTKGLNPDVTMKDSGVEWLGELPNHWRVSRIKNFAKIESGHTPSKTKEEYWVDCNIPWVSLNDSKQLKHIDYIDDTFYKISELGMANSSAHLLPARSVVFTRDASIGLSAITTKPMAVSQHLIAWVCDENFIVPEFLLLVFYAMEKEFERYTFGATLKTIGMDNVRSLECSFPPVKEQYEIISWAFGKLESIKASLSKVENIITLLQERRTALISAAVTGKIDVRDWVAPETQDLEETQEVTA